MRKVLTSAWNFFRERNGRSEKTTDGRPFKEDDFIDSEEREEKKEDGHDTISKIKYIMIFIILLFQT